MSDTILRTFHIFFHPLCNSLTNVLSVSLFYRCGSKVQRLQRVWINCWRLHSLKLDLLPPSFKKVLGNFCKNLLLASKLLKFWQIIVYIHLISRISKINISSLIMIMDIYVSPSVLIGLVKFYQFYWLYKKPAWFHWFFFIMFYFKFHLFLLCIIFFFDLGLLCCSFF